IYGFAGGWRGGSGDVHVSRDGGETWALANGDLYSGLQDEAAKPGLRAIATCLNDADVVYLSYRGYKTGPSDDENFMGVARTTDGGKTWKLVWKDTFETPGENSKGAWLNERFGPDWGENPISLGVAPTNSEICFATDLGRTMYTRDGGKTWLAAYSKRMDDGSWATTGLDVTTNYGVHFDPFDKNRIIISYTDIGAFASDNAGVTWRSATTGVPGRWVNTTYWLVFDPEVKGRVWGVTGRHHDLPRPKMWRRTRVSDYEGGVILSDDGGRTWRPWGSDMPQTAMTHIVLDPESPKEARVLYATGFGTGVWKSTDGGKTWALKNKGLPEHEPFAWWISRDTNGVLYLIIARRSDDGSYGNELDGALYRSKDGAESWEKIDLPEGLNGPNGLAIDPEDPARLYLAVWGRTRGETGGIWLSTDAGESWDWIFDGDRFVYDVTMDPRDPNILYACGFSSSAWRSEDKGLTWTRIKGFNFKWGHRVVPDPYNPDMVYVTTFGGSVWYGPAKGDPDAAEDIVTPVATPGNLWGIREEEPAE
ncbi:MAG: WD40/YVTN/BNR-like repeat-containing protein, partial [Planctomycetota bacterium]